MDGDLIKVKVTTTRCISHTREYELTIERKDVEEWENLEVGGAPVSKYDIEDYVYEKYDEFAENHDGFTGMTLIHNEEDPDPDEWIKHVEVKNEQDS